MRSEGGVWNAKVTRKGRSHYPFSAPRVLGFWVRGFWVKGFWVARSWGQASRCARPMVRPLKTQQIAPRTRAPAGRGRTDARAHSRHARSRSHHGHRAAAATPESLQAAGKLPCATTLSSLDAAVVTRDGGVE